MNLNTLSRWEIPLFQFHNSYTRHLQRDNKLINSRFRTTGKGKFKLAYYAALKFRLRKITLGRKLVKVVQEIYVVPRKRSLLWLPGDKTFSVSDSDIFLY